MAKFDETPLAYAIDLQLDLADIVIGEMHRRNWTAKQVARKTGLSPQTIERVVCAEGNISLKAIGRILHVLDARGKIVRKDGRDLFCKADSIE